MFHHLKFFQKLLVLILMYAIVALLEWWFYNLSLTSSNIIIVISLTFIQCWNLILVGFLFFQTFKHVTFPAIFYQKLNFETPLYFKILGLNTYQFVLINSFFRHLNKRVYLKGKSRTYIKTYHAETKQSETSHWLSMFPTFVVQFLFLYHGAWSYFIWLTIWSIIFNVYPILLQRKNRFIIEKRFPALLQ